MHRQTRKEIQCGVIAKKALQTLVDSAAAAHDRSVSCVPVNKDRYGRVVATCYVNGVDVAASLVSNGHAVAYRQYGMQYVGFEQQAKDSLR